MKMFDDRLVTEVWNKATTVEGFSPDVLRKDCCGAWIMRSEYGNRNSAWGWEIDHVFPESKGGADDLDNLRPMQWENNMSKGDDFPVYWASVRAKNRDNIREMSQYKVNDKLEEYLRKLYQK